MGWTNKLIAVVEDHPQIAYILKILFLDGYNTQIPRIFNNAEDCIECLRCGKKFDLLVVDIKLKGKLSGIDLIKYIYENKIPMMVLVVTGLKLDDETEVTQYNSTNFMTLKIVEKPFKQEDIMYALQKLQKDHGCKIIEYFKVPELEIKVVILEEKVKEIEERTFFKLIRNFFLSLIEDFTSLETKHQIIRGVIISLIILGLTTFISFKIFHPI